MISVICVFNNKEVLKKNLLRSLKRQDCKYDYVGIDNTDHRFKSAAEALNYGFTLTNPKSKYVFFVHQDILLENKNSLDKIESEILKIKNLGIAGFAGKDYKNIQIGYIQSCGKPWGSPINKYEEVFTLDELGLIIPKNVFNKHKFDSDVFDGWHCYGVDYSLWAHNNNLKVVVLPVWINHNSAFTAFTDNKLRYFQRKLLGKYKKYKMIYTTCGRVNNLILSYKILRFKLIGVG